MPEVWSAWNSLQVRVKTAGVESTTLLASEIGRCITEETGESKKTI